MKPIDDDEDSDGDDLRQYLQDMEDPLGIGGDDRKSKSHATDLDDSDDDEVDPNSAAAILSPRRAKRMAARKQRGALDPTDEKFDAVMYLVKVHQNTIIQDLQRGKASLEVKVTSRQKQLEFLVKDNFARFMICKDAVDNIYVTISGQKVNTSAKVVDLATGEFKDLWNRSRAVFVPLLDRQVEIDRIKSVLGILKRSQFIFNLPRRMRDNIARGEYSKVVLNYKKVRSLVATASHASIKNVVGEVDAIVRELHTTLFEDLDQANATLRQQEESIKLLVDLGSPIDPAWYAIDLRHSRMKAMLIERASKINAMHESSNHYSLSSFAQQQQHHQNKSASSIIISVSNLLQEHMPQFLQLANNFFARSYHKSLSEKKKNALSQKHPLEDFLSKLHELIALYSDIVIRSFYGNTARNMEEAAKLGIRADAFNPNLASNHAISQSHKPNSISGHVKETSGPTLIVTGKKKKNTGPPAAGSNKQTSHRSSASVDGSVTPLPKQLAHAASESTLSGSSGSSNASTGAISSNAGSLLSQSHAGIDRSSINPLAPSSASSAAFNHSRSHLSSTLPATGNPNQTTSLVSAAYALNYDEPIYDKEKVMAILKLYQLLTSISPADWLEPLADLLDLVTRTFVKEVFADVLSEARIWYAQEDWVVLDQQRMITSLPFTFESALTSTLDRLSGIISAEDPLVIYVQKRFIQCIECYADNIHHLAFVFNDSIFGSTYSNYRSNGSNFRANNFGSAVGSQGGHHHHHHSRFGSVNEEEEEEDDEEIHDDFNSGRYEVPTLSEDARLLMILNNCTYTKKHLLPALIEKFQGQYGISLYNTKAQRDGVELLERLEDMIIRKYVCRKTNILNGVIRNGVLFSGFDWAGIQAPPTGVRDFIMTALLELVFIHDELHRVSRSLVRPVLTTVLENIYQCFIDCLQFIDIISNHGVLQIGMEIDFLSSVMRKYKSPIANGFSAELEHILQFNAIMDPKSDEVLAKDKKTVKGLVSSKLQEASLLTECFTGRDVNDLKL